MFVHGSVHCLEGDCGVPWLARGEGLVCWLRLSGPCAAARRGGGASARPGPVLAGQARPRSRKRLHPRAAAGLRGLRGRGLAAGGDALGLAALGCLEGQPGGLGSRPAGPRRPRPDGSEEPGSGRRLCGALHLRSTLESADVSEGSTSEASSLGRLCELCQIF